MRNWEHWNPILSAQRQIRSATEWNVTSHQLTYLPQLKENSLTEKLFIHFPHYSSFIFPGKVISGLKCVEFIRVSLWNDTDMSNWFPHNPILLLMIIPINLSTVPNCLLMNQELMVPGAIQMQDIKVSSEHSEPATQVNRECKKCNGKEEEELSLAVARWFWAQQHPVWSYCGPNGKEEITKTSEKDGGGMLLYYTMIAPQTQQASGTNIWKHVLERYPGE